MAVHFLFWVFVKNMQRIRQGIKLYGPATQPEKGKGKNTIVPSLVFSIQNRKKKKKRLNEKSRIILKTSHDIKSVGEEYY